jgi:hypothetical protein
MIFDGPDGLRYDVAIHDFIEADGTLASAERVASAWGETMEEVEADRAERARWQEAAHERLRQARGELG